MANPIAYHGGKKIAEVGLVTKKQETLRISLYVFHFD